MGSLLHQISPIQKLNDFWPQQKTNIKKNHTNSYTKLSWYSFKEEHNLH